jgi:hypothetical protein
MIFKNLRELIQIIEVWDTILSEITVTVFLSSGDRREGCDFVTINS